MNPTNILVQTTTCTKSQLVHNTHTHIYIYLKSLNNLHKKISILISVNIEMWSRALDVRLSEWCCSVTMVWVQIPSREEQKFDSSKI